MTRVAEVAFNAERHEYKVGGHIVPSVTQILGILQDFGGVSADVLERAADFGRNAHEAVDLANKGVLDEESLDPALVPYLAAWRRFLEDAGATVLASEVRVYHPGQHYAGTLDALVSIRNKVAVVDVKTGAVPRTVGPQLAAYAEAYSANEDNPHAIRRRLCVQLVGDEALAARGYRVHECKDHADWSIFQSCLNIWRFRNA